MDFSKSLPYYRKVFAALLSFWGYFLVKYLGEAFVLSFYVNADTQFVGIHPSYAYICLIFGLVLLVPYSYDTALCDEKGCYEYILALDEKAEFSFKNELMTQLRNPLFYVGIAIWLLFAAICYGFWWGLLITAISALTELFARRSWFFARKSIDRLKPDKIYAIAIIKHILLWAGIICGAIFAVGMIKLGFASVWNTLKYVVAGIIILSVVLAILLRIRNLFRVLRVQKRFFARLEQVCRDNGIRFRRPMNIYSSTLLSRNIGFVLESRHKRYNCIVVPTLRRSTPLYFVEKGVIQRIKSFKILKIEVSNRDKFIEYRFKDSEREQQNILLLSPVPREIFVGPPGNPTPTDNGEDFHGALIYTGSAFCNYLERELADNRIYEKKSNISH